MNVWERTLSDATNTPEPSPVSGYYGEQPAPTRPLTPGHQADQERAEFDTWRLQRQQQRQRQSTHPGLDTVIQNDVAKMQHTGWPSRSREPLAGNKTYLGAGVWIALGALSMAGVQVPGMELDTGDSLRMIWEGAMFIFTRLGIKKLGQ